MVNHISIDPGWGNVAVYNEINKETTYFDIKEVAVYNVQKIEAMLGGIKNKIEGEIGYSCICLSERYDNNMRKEFIEKGKQYGFLKIKFIDWRTSLYVNYISKINYKLCNDDLVFLILSNDCCIWKRNNLKTKMVKYLKLTSLSIEDFLIIKRDLCNNKNPVLLICGFIDEIKLEIIKEVFPKSKMFVFLSALSYVKGALIKARIMAKDPKVLRYDVVPQLQEQLDVNINNSISITLNFGLLLPYEETLNIPILNNDTTTLKIEICLRNSKKKYMMKRKKMIFRTDKISLELKIDENEIFTFHYSANIKNIEHRLSELYIENSIEKPQLNIPQKIKNNDNSINAIGIDFGTSRCCAAVYRRNGIETIPLDTEGERQMPSYISFDEENHKCGIQVIRRLQTHARSIVFDSKRIIGQNFTDVKIDEIWPFELIEMENKPLIKLRGTDSPIIIKPEEITAILMKDIKQKAEEFQGKELNEVVITVPATFNHKQKIATHVAAELAGWKTVILLSEPVAASIACFYDRPIPYDFTLLLFDLGGGTLDICIFKIAKNKLLILTNHGEENLGGRDFDNILFNYFANILEKDYEINVKAKDKFKYKLLLKCMEIKHALSSEIETSLNFDDFNIQAETFLNIKRSDFEKMSTKLLNRIKENIIQSLSEASYTSSDIDKVLLVGGGCRMPMIRELLRNMFTNAEHSCNKHPDEIVAIGAAYYASFLNSQSNTNNCSIM